MSLNDPNWGRRGNDGPPDLDEMWNRLKQRLGGRPRPPSAGGDGGLPLRSGLWLAVALVGFIWFASGFYIVDASQRGVVLRFGSYAETTQPGPRWHIPYPVESVEIVNLSQVRTVEVGYHTNVKTKVLQESLMLTDDENIIDLQFAVQYVLKDPKDFVFNNRSAEDAVKQAAESAMREEVGKQRMDFVLYQGRAELAVAAQATMQKILDRYSTGISVSRLTLQQAQPPEQVQAAFDDAVKANQDRERQKSEGQAYANDVVPKAQGTAARLQQEAEGYRQRVTLNATGEASRFSQIAREYKRAPAVTRQRMYMDAMQQVLSSTTKVVVDDRAGGNLLMLPLDKILQMGAASQPPVVEGPKEPPPQVDLNAAPPAAEAGVRSRDALRTRDREARP